MLFKCFSHLLHTFSFIVSLSLFSFLFVPKVIEASPMTTTFINEIHYDNTGVDSGEYVEIVSNSNIVLTDWSLLLYNGNNGALYDSFEFDTWSYISTHAQFDFYTIKTVGIQNGSPDGLVLSDGTDIVQFLSYEGVFTATSGIAKDFTSNDIGVSELSSTSVGLSLQLSGVGSDYSDFVWEAPQLSTFGLANIGQEFTIPNKSVFSVNEPSSFILFFLFIILIMSKYRFY